MTTDGFISEAGIDRAKKIFPKIEPVTACTRLIDPDSAARIIATVDRDLQPCTRVQATSLVAELFGAYPSLTVTSRSDEEIRDFKLYTVKMFEAFSMFGFAIGKAAVHGGSGIPAKQRYKPQPSDVVEFCKAESERRLDVKTMAQRHLAESKRRAAEREEEKRYATTPEQRQRVADLAASLRAQSLPDASR